MKIKLHCGINEEPVLVQCERDGDDWYVAVVEYKGVDIGGCLEQDALDELCKDWLLVFNEVSRRQAADEMYDFCF